MGCKRHSIEGNLLRCLVADLASDNSPTSLRLDSAGVPSPALVVVELDDADWSLASVVAARLAQPTPVIVGVSSRALPDKAAPLLESLTCTLAPSGPGRAWIRAEDGDLEAIAATVAAAPLAAITLSGVLSLAARSTVADGLLAESLAYSMLLAGPEFARWSASRPSRSAPDVADPVLLTREGDVLSVVLNRPERHNAFGRLVRDGLLEALSIAELDSTVREVVVTGNGRSFSSGGDLDEFGTAPDVSTAHLIRLNQSAAHAVHVLRDRVRVVVHGACIGAGA